jgi:hypothetical protein
MRCITFADIKELKEMKKRTKSVTKSSTLKKKESKPLLQLLTGTFIEALYLNGELIAQNHALNAIDVLDILQDRKLIDFKVYEYAADFYHQAPGTFDKSGHAGYVGDEILP